MIFVVDTTKSKRDTWANDWYVCPNCGYDSVDVGFNYCPSCGEGLIFDVDVQEAGEGKK